MDKRELRIERPRVRKTWRVRPFTRVEKPKRIYQRRKEKSNEPISEERILGIDLGHKKIGLAISDPLGVTARPLETVDRQDLSKRLANLIRQQNVTEIVLGLPLNMDGTRGKMAEEAERFAAELEERFHIPVTLYDERLTSVSAQKVMKEAGESPSRNKGRVDQISAALLLEGYLNRRR